LPLADQGKLPPTIALSSPLDCISEHIKSLKGRNILESPRSTLDGLRKAYSRFLHPFMRFGRTANEDDFFRSSYSLVPILTIQSNTEDRCNSRAGFFLAWFPLHNHTPVRLVSVFVSDGTTRPR
jgi:hypothetical protein